MRFNFNFHKYMKKDFNISVNFLSLFTDFKRIAFAFPGFTPTFDVLVFDNIKSTYAHFLFRACMVNVQLLKIEHVSLHSGLSLEDCSYSSQCLNAFKVLFFCAKPNLC